MLAEILFLWIDNVNSIKSVYMYVFWFGLSVFKFNSNTFTHLLAE